MIRVTQQIADAERGVVLVIEFDGIQRRGVGHRGMAGTHAGPGLGEIPKFRKTVLRGNGADGGFARFGQRFPAEFLGQSFMQPGGPTADAGETGVDKFMSQGAARDGGVAFEHGDADAAVKLAAAPFGGASGAHIVFAGLGDNGQAFGGGAAEFK